MKALIIGAAGFVGGYLIEHILENKDWEIYATKMKNETIEYDVHSMDLDILNTDQMQDMLDTIKPDYIFHLAAQSSVSVSWKNPELTVDVNIKGTLNLLDTVRKLQLKPRILLIGSGEEYGHILESEVPIKESNTLRPQNIYAITKTAQNMIGQVYATAYGMDIVMVRAFNHIGPRQSRTFVVADFCRQVALIEAGKQENVIRVGNLKAKRDFTDVRDIVRAYVLLVERGRVGEVYNVGSGKAVSIEEILDIILSMSTTHIKVEVDESKLRPIDVAIIEADISKIKSNLGWFPKIKLDEIIADCIQFWRRS